MDPCDINLKVWSVMKILIMTKITSFWSCDVDHWHLIFITNWIRPSNVSPNPRSLYLVPFELWHSHHLYGEGRALDGGCIRHETIISPETICHVVYDNIFSGCGHLKEWLILWHFVFDQLYLFFIISLPGWNISGNYCKLDVSIPHINDKIANTIPTFESHRQFTHQH